MDRSSQTQNSKPIKAWVVFSGQADMTWLKILKPGFRHCAVLLNDGQNWMTLDPMSSYTDINIHTVPNEFNMPLWLRDRGHIVVPAPVTRLNKSAPWSVYSCVEAVKRVLGIHRRFIFTPWQLYRYLTKQQNSEIFNTKGDLAWEV